MRINNNIAAMNTQSRLASAQNAQAKSLEKLSSGLRINKAGDDAAGLAISEKMRGQIGGLNQATRNAQDGISLIQTAEGGLNETHSILNRMRELAVQSSNDTNTDDDRVSIQQEMNQLSSEINRISSDTKFNNQELLDGEFSDKKLHIGANEGQSLSLSISDMSSESLGVQGEAYTATVGSFNISSIDNIASVEIKMGTTGATETLADIDDTGKVVVTLANTADVSDASIADVKKALEDKGLTVELAVGTDDTAGQGIATGTLTPALNAAAAKSFGVGIDVSTQPKADAAISIIDDAINKVSAERSKLGATQNRLDHTINNLTTTSENLTAAESRIRDVDMAKEMMNFTKNNILNQASTAMLAQANQMPQGVLQLLG